MPGSHIEEFPCDFCFESQSCFVFGNDTQRHANKGAQHIGERRLNSVIDLYDINLVCTKFGVLIILGAIVPKGCTYPSDCLSSE